MPKLIWNDLEHREKEFELAKRYLADSNGRLFKPGTKLSRKGWLNKKDSLGRTTETDGYPQLTHSFIIVEINGERKILAMASKAANNDNRYLGSGTFGDVKLAEDVDGSLYALKIESRIDESPNESSIARDLDIAGKRSNRSSHTQKTNKRGEIKSQKHYTAYKYLGQNLNSYLRKNKHKLNDLELLKEARNAVKAVDDLHKGQASKSLTKYAHLDLKPDNMTRDDKGTHIIDLGRAEKNIKDSPKGTYGSPRYQLRGRYQNSCTKEEADLTAIARTCIIPEKMIITARGRTYLRKRKPTDNYILSDRILEDNPMLKETLDKLVCANGQPMQEKYSADLLLQHIDNAITAYEKVESIFNKMKKIDKIEELNSYVQNLQRSDLSSKEVRQVRDMILTDLQNDQSPFQKFKQNGDLKQVISSLDTISYNKIPSDQKVNYKFTEMENALSGNEKTPKDLLKDITRLDETLSSNEIASLYKKIITAAKGNKDHYGNKNTSVFRSKIKKASLFGTSENWKNLKKQFKLVYQKKLEQEMQEKSQNKQQANIKSSPKTVISNNEFIFFNHKNDANQGSNSLNKSIEDKNNGEEWLNSLDIHKGLTKQ